MSGAGLIELLAARLGGRGVRRASPSLREALVDLSARSAEPGVAGQEEALRQAYGRLSMEMPTENLRLPTSRVSLDDLPDVGPGWRDKDKVAHYADLLAQSEPPPIMIARDARNGAWDVIDGNHRLEVMRAAGRREIPAMDATGAFKGRYVSSDAMPPKAAPRRTGPDAGPSQAGRDAYEAQLRAEGFDVDAPFYRGMTQAMEGDEFRPTVTSGYEDQGPGVSVSRRVAEAEVYAGAAPGPATDGATIYPVVGRGKFVDDAEYYAAIERRVAGGENYPEAARAVQLEMMRNGYTANASARGEVRFWPDEDGRVTNVRSRYGQPRTAPDGGPVQAGRDADGAALDLDRLKAEGWDTSRAWARVVPDTAADPWEVRPLGRFGPGLYFGDDVVEGQMTNRVNRIGARQGHSAASHRAYVRDGAMATEHEWREVYRRHSKGPFGEERNPRDAEQRAVRELERNGFIGVIAQDRNDGSLSINVFRRENILPVPADGRSGPNAGSDRNALQRALRERMERE